MNDNPQTDGPLAQIIAFPSPLDWSGNVDANVQPAEHANEAAEVVFPPLRHDTNGEETQWKALDTDVERLRHSLAESARSNSEQAQGLATFGVPLPTLPTHTSPHQSPTSHASVLTLTGNRSTDVGTLAHRLVALHALTAGSDLNLLASLHATAYDSIRAIPPRRRVLAIQAVSHAHRYLVSYAPQHPWVLLGTEYECGTGRVDVAWQHTATGEVFFDEVKTSGTAAVRRTPASWVKQARRYSAAGCDRFGDAFLGTRLLPVASPHMAVLVRASGAPVPIDPTPAEPMRAVTR